MTKKIKHYGEKGGKGGGGTTRAAAEAPNTLQSRATARVIDIVSHGECVGLANREHPLRSIYYDGLPIENDNGTKNWTGIQIQERLGLPNQDPFQGFDETEEEIIANVELTTLTPRTIKVTDNETDALRIKIRIPALTKQNKENGDLNGTSVSYKFESRIGVGAYTLIATEVINAKCVTPQELSYRIQKPEGAGTADWDVKVTRITPDSADVTLQNKTFLGSITKLVEAKLQYADFAGVAQQADSSQFGDRIPPRSFDWVGMVLDVPSNYVAPDYNDPNDITKRQYPGLWDGTFKRAWTDNPAWILWGMLTDREWGLGRVIKPGQVDKWTLYQIAKYCDEFVSDGNGGQEPRYAINTQITTSEQAYAMLQSIASVFRGMSYWGSGSVTFVADLPTDPVKLVSPANIIEGEFTYTGTALKNRHSVVRVSWNDPTDGYKLAVEIIEDPEMITRFGYRPVDITAYGCVSRGQAMRMGRWLLDTERYETETVSYRASFDHADVRPGNIIEVYDPSYAGVRLAGRIVGSTSNTVTLDAPVTLEPGHIYDINLVRPDGNIVTRAVSTTAGTHTTLTLGAVIDNLPSTGDVLIFSTAVPTQRSLVTAITGTTVSFRNDIEIEAGYAYHIGFTLEDGTVVSRPLNAPVTGRTFSWTTALTTLPEVEKIAFVYAPSEGYQSVTVSSRTATTATLAGTFTFIDGYEYEALFASADDRAYRKLTNAPGTTSVLTWSDATNALPLNGSMYGITGTDLTPREFRVLNVREVEQHIFEITALNYDRNKYARIEDGLVLPPPTTSLFTSTAVPEAPTDLVAIRRPVIQDGVLTEKINIFWKKSDSLLVTHYKISWKKDDGTWESLPDSYTNSTELPSRGAGIYGFSIRAVNVAGKESSVLYDELELEADRPLAEPVITNLRVENKLSSASTWEGADLKIAWSVEAPEDWWEEISEGWEDPYLKDYVVTVKTAADAVLGTFYTKDRRFVLSKERGMEINGGVALRNAKITVACRDISDVIYTAAVKSFSNPAPTAPASVTLTSAVRIMTITVPRCEELDYSRTRVWVSTTNDFNPSVVSPVIDAPGTQFNVDVIPGTTYYVRVAYLDDFSTATADLNISSQVSLAVPGLTESDLSTTPPANVSGTPALSATSIIAGDGTEITRLNSTCASVTDATGYVIEIDDAVASWTETLPTNALTNFIVRTGPTYRVRYKAVNRTGLLSASWSSWSSSTATGGDVTAPGPITSPSINGSTTGIVLSWTPPTDADFHKVKIYRNTVNNSSTATYIGEALSTLVTYRPPAAFTTYYFWGATVDRTGNVGTKTFIGSDQLDGRVELAIDVSGSLSDMAVIDTGLALVEDLTDPVFAASGFNLDVPLTMESVVESLQDYLDRLTVYPEQFGAIADGVADDTAAIQAALDTGYDVTLTAGKTYSISDTLNVSSNHQYFGGNGILQASGTTPHVKVSACSGVVLDLVFNSPTSASWAVYIDSAYNVTIRRLHIINGFGGIFIENSERVIVNWARLVCFGPGILWYGTASHRSEGLSINYAWISSGTVYNGFDWNGNCHDLNINDMHMYCGTSKSASNPKGFYVRNSSGGPLPTKARINNLTIMYPAVHGMEWTVKCDDVDINNVKIIGGTGDGIKLTSAHAKGDVRISGGRITGNTGYGINNPGGAVLVSGDVDLAGNTAGTTSGEVWLFAPRVVMGDDAYYGALSGSNPVLNFDANDYLSYTRSSNTLGVTIGGSSLFSVSPSGAFATTPAVADNSLRVATTEFVVRLTTAGRTRVFAEDYGAVVNNSAIDNAAAIAAAEAAAAAINGVVVFKPGDYYFKSQIGGARNKLSWLGERTSLVYNGVSTTIDLVKFGDNSVSYTEMLVQGISVRSLTNMTAGSAVWTPLVCRSLFEFDSIQGQDYHAVNGNKLYNGIYADRVDQVRFVGTDLAAKNNGFQIRGALSTGPKADCWVDIRKICFCTNAILMGGAFGGLYVGVIDLIVNGQNIVANQSLQAENNRELFLNGTICDTATNAAGANILLDDPGALLVQMTNPWVATGTGHGIWIKQNAGKVVITSPRVFNHDGDAIRNSAGSGCILLINGGQMHDNDGWGVNPNVTGHHTAVTNCHIFANGLGVMNPAFAPASRAYSNSPEFGSLVVPNIVGGTAMTHTSTAPSLSSLTGVGLSVQGSSTLKVNIGSDPSAPFGGWMQATNGSGTAYGLHLNPLGGGVAIGSLTIPTATLDVTGTGKFSGAVTTGALTATTGLFSGAVGIGSAAPSAPWHFFVGDGVADRRGLFRNSNAYALAVTQGAANGVFHIGTTASATPSLIFSNNSGTARFTLTDAGALSISAGFSATTGAFSTSVTTANLTIDTQFYSVISSSNPVINFDSNDYMFFNRSANAYAFVIGGVSAFGATAAGFSMAGTLTTGGSITATGNIIASGVVGAGNGVNGKAQLQPGTTTRTGYVEFRNAADLRYGYMGFADTAGPAINMVAENGASWSFTGAAAFGSNVSVTGTFTSSGLITGSAGISTTTGIFNGSTKIIGDSINALRFENAVGGTRFHNVVPSFSAVSNALNTLTFNASTTVAGTQAAGLTLNGEGRVGIGNTAPGYNLDVTGTGRFTDTLTITKTGGDPAIYLNGTTASSIQWAQVGVGAPTFTTRSVGTKLVYYPSFGASSADYATGIEGSVLWNSVPTTSQSFKWYGGTTQALLLTGTGAATFTAGVTATGFTASQAVGTPSVVIEQTGGTTGSASLYMLGGTASGQSYLGFRNGFNIGTATTAGGAISTVLSITPAGNVTIGGSGAGNPLTVSRNQNALTNFVVSNATAGTTARTGFQIAGDAASATFDFFSSSWSPTGGGDDAASGGRMLATGAGGLALRASHASGSLRFYTGATERFNINSAGLATFASTVASPWFSVDSTAYFSKSSGNPILAVDANDYMLYERTANEWQFFVGGGTARAKITATGALFEGTGAFTGVLSAGGLIVNGVTATAAPTANSVAIRDASGNLGAVNYTAAGTSPSYVWTESDAALNAKSWQTIADGGSLIFRTVTDAFGTGADFITAVRSGTTVTSLTLAATAINFTGAVGITGALTTSAGVSATTGTFSGAVSMSALTVGGVAASASTTANSPAMRDANGYLFGAGLVAQSAAPGFTWNETDAAANAKVWVADANGGVLTWRTQTDAFGAGATFMTVTRSGTTVASVAFAATALNFTGAMTVTGALSATSFSGSGAGLTALNGSNISTGTVADARLSSQVLLKGAMPKDEWLTLAPAVRELFYWDGTANYTKGDIQNFWSNGNALLLQLTTTKVEVTKPFKLPRYTVAGLPTASTMTDCRVMVSDATAPTFGAVVVGGGSTLIPVFSDGTNWRVG